jgi:hypothetical protein
MSLCLERPSEARVCCNPKVALHDGCKATPVLKDDTAC